MKLFANELEPNQQVQTTFLVLNKDVRQKKTGEPYLSLVLGDKTGDIDAKMWDGVAEIVDTFERNDYVKIRGQATVYQNKLQLRVDRLMRADERDTVAFGFTSVREPACPRRKRRPTVRAGWQAPARPSGSAPGPDPN